MISALRNCPAPAKLNRFLHVTGRRPDGYHLLETVFQLIDLCDLMHFGVRPDGAIVRRGAIPALAADADDLSVRAARLLAQESGTALGVDIEIVKLIPVGGGLGGGSSDAATTMLALNRLWNLRWPVARLARLGLRLGADVPVFVHGASAYATGIGEELVAVPLPEQFFVLISPGVAVSTAEVFAAPELTRDTKLIKIPGLSRGLAVSEGRNDLEPVVCARFPEVAAALAALRREALAAGEDPDTARMTGSGSCVFLPVSDCRRGEAVRARIAALGVGKVFVVRSLANHPLRNWAFERQRSST